MFEDHSVNARMADCKTENDFRVCNADTGQKYILQWSPQEEKKFLFKRQYVSSSRSVPKRSKRFVRYKISRSLNFDATNSQNSSSDGSSVDGDKYLTRSAKIMRALNFNSSPSYYGKTRIKKSLNFNSTPSPKRFSYKGKTARKPSALNPSAFSPASEGKLLNFDDSHSQTDSADNSLLFTSSESIDENQNETPSRQNLKIREPLNFSTPTVEKSKRGSASFSPLLRSGLKERIDSIVYITATPNPVSLKRGKSRLKYTDELSVSAPRNLFRDFHDADDERPSTPENVVRIVPESMSAIKRSHKKERSSRWSERNCTNLSASDPTVDSNSTPQMSRKAVNHPASSSPDSKKDRSWMKSPACHSELDLSDTGSLFEYKEAQENSSKKLLDNFSSSNDEELDFRGWDTKVENEDEEEVDRKLPISELANESLSISSEDSDPKRIDGDGDGDVPSTPPQLGPSSSKPVTPENRINIFEHLLRDSIKKSHKKIKDENKKKLFSPLVMRFRNDVVKQENVEQPSEADIPLRPVERATTPENVNSSRLLLSQYSSVKKSHKKDKHTKILSSFMKRQEYFNRDMEVLKDSTSKISMEDLLVYEDNVRPELGRDKVEEGTSYDELSPSKRRKSLEDPLERNASRDDPQQLDIAKQEFRIFSPLKRRGTAKPTLAKGYTCVYRVPDAREDVSEEDIADITSSRCLTPIAMFGETPTKTAEREEPVDLEMESCSTDEQTGRSTPQNMSTSTLYCNVDSIKKSHKKNKRGCNLLKEAHAETSKPNEEEQSRVVSPGRTSPSTSNDHVRRANVFSPSTPPPSTSTTKDHRRNSVASPKTPSPPTSIAVHGDRNTVTLPNIHLPSTSTAVDYAKTPPISPSKTPPNTLKTKDYMRLMQKTSIKRSHKKDREQKRYEGSAEEQQFSDDGSLFGDEERIALVEADTVLAK